MPPVAIQHLLVPFGRREWWRQWSRRLCGVNNDVCRGDRAWSSLCCCCGCCNCIIPLMFAAHSHLLASLFFLFAVPSPRTRAVALPRAVVKEPALRPRVVGSGMLSDEIGASLMPGMGRVLAKARCSQVVCCENGSHVQRKNGQVSDVRSGSARTTYTTSLK